MPREFFNHAHSDPNWDGPKVTVGWDRHPDVQIGVVVHRENAIAYLGDALAEVDITDEQRTAVIEALTQPEAPIFGWHTSQDRSGLNRLIKTLRRARDAAFGADA